MGKKPISVETRVRLGRTFRAARRAAKLTQTQVAAASGISKSDISRIENGRINPTLDNIERLAGAVGMSADVVLSAAKSGRKLKP